MNVTKGKIIKTEIDKTDNFSFILWSGEWRTLFILQQDSLQVMLTYVDLQLHEEILLQRNMNNTD